MLCFPGTHLNPSRVAPPVFREKKTNTEMNFLRDHHRVELSFLPVEKAPEVPGIPDNDYAGRKNGDAYWNFHSARLKSRQTEQLVFQ